MMAKVAPLGDHLRSSRSDEATRKVPEEEHPRCQQAVSGDWGLDAAVGGAGV